MRPVATLTNPAEVRAILGRLGMRAQPLPRAPARDPTGQASFEFACALARPIGKVRTLAGNYQLTARMPRLLVPLLNPSWFAFVSHKVMRLICPWALAALLVASSIEAVTSHVAAALVLRALLAGQLLFYALALAGSRAGRLGMLAYTFVVLNAAAVVGLWRFAVGRQRIMW